MALNILERMANGVSKKTNIMVSNIFGTILLKINENFNHTVSINFAILSEIIEPKEIIRHV